VAGDLLGDLPEQDVAGIAVAEAVRGARGLGRFQSGGDELVRSGQLLAQAGDRRKHVGVVHEVAESGRVVEERPDGHRIGVREIVEPGAQGRVEVDRPVIDQLQDQHGGRGLAVRGHPEDVIAGDGLGPLGRRGDGVRLAAIVDADDGVDLFGPLPHGFGVGLAGAAVGPLEGQAHLARTFDRPGSV
jgi:hypothetical protein